MSVNERLERHKAKEKRALETLKNVPEHAVTPKYTIVPKSTKKIIAGKPCVKDKSVIRRAKQMLSIVTSEKVPEEVSKARMAICEVCEYCTKVDDKWFCECCGCPKWNGAALHNKTTRSKHFCPVGKFGVYDGNDTLARR